MAKDIIRELLKKYKVEDEHLTGVVLHIIELGFDANWLRNIQIIKDFDILYKINTPTMRIYTNLGIKHKVSSDLIRAIIRNRNLYEI